MPVPNEPTYTFEFPFANNGTANTIPVTKSIPGQANLTDGFPFETQQPLDQGGISPERPDFNGILKAITTYNFWQQSGGQFTYKQTLNYKQPNIVFSVVNDIGILWWCVKENGPDSANGVHAPGDEADAGEYWLDLLTYLTESGGGRSRGVPVGTVISYYGTTAPDGYFPCDGTYSFSATDYPLLYEVLGNKNVMPDFRARFIRGYDTRNTVDPNGSSRAIGSVQGDAMRNITGQVDFPTVGVQEVFGVFYFGRPEDTNGGTPNRGSWVSSFHFDASRQVPTSTEIRPTNVNLLYCMAHD